MATAQSTLSMAASAACGKLGSSLALGAPPRKNLLIESVAWSALAEAQAMAPVFIAVWLKELTVVGCTFVCFLCAGIAVLYVSVSCSST